jgi:RNA polymerase sigma factor (sigma-70 family)
VSESYEAMPKKSAQNNNNLIQGCIDNDRKSQEQLYQQFYHPMLALCLRYTKNQEDAIEVLHEGLLKVFQHMHEFDESISTLFTWVHTIMVRTAIDFLRKRNKIIVNVTLVEEIEPAVSPEILVDKPAYDILRFLKRLPETTALVFNLHVVEGYKHKEIAEMLQICEGTSKWHVSEAKKQLSLLLENRARA